MMLILDAFRPFPSVFGAVGPERYEVMRVKRPFTFVVPEKVTNAPYLFDRTFQSVSVIRIPKDRLNDHHPIVAGCADGSHH